MKCPNSWKKNFKYPPKFEKIQSPKIEKSQTKIKLGHSISTQTRVDMKCPNSCKKPFSNTPTNLKKYSPKIEKCRTKKKFRAFHIHSIISRHEMPKQLENKHYILKNLKKNLNRKMSDQKKIRAFHIHSNMSRHEMPKQLKQY